MAEVETGAGVATTGVYVREAAAAELKAMGGGVEVRSEAGETERDGTGVEERDLEREREPDEEGTVAELKSARRPGEEAEKV